MLLTLFYDLNSPLASMRVDISDPGLAAFSRTVSVRSVLRNGSKPQVIDVDARCTAIVFADNVHTVRDGSIYPFPSVTVCPLRLPVDINLAIPVLVCPSNPDKTVALPLSPKCKGFFWCLNFYIGDGFRVTVSFPSFVVHYTPTPSA